MASSTSPVGKILSTLLGVGCLVVALVVLLRPIDYVVSADLVDESGVSRTSQDVTIRCATVLTGAADQGDVTGRDTFAEDDIETSGQLDDTRVVEAVQVVDRCSRARAQRTGAATILGVLGLAFLAGVGLNLVSRRAERRRLMGV